MRLFATIHFGDLGERGPQFELIQALGYLPELYFASGWEGIPAQGHRELSRVVQGEMGGCSVHLPYRNLFPGDGDPKALDTLRRAAWTAALYSPAHLVGHASYRSTRDAKGAPLRHLSQGPGRRGGLKGADAEPGEAFLLNSREAWGAVMGECGGRLFLENTIERSPWPILRILEGLPAEGAGFCLDVGHWHSLGMGAEFGNLPEWAALSKGRLGHIHIHDNDGTADQHLPIGKGRIDFGLLWELLRRHGLDPSATVENPAPRGLSLSARYLGSLAP